MREKQNNWQRIESVISWANMTTNYFARYIGLPRGENLYQIKRGNNGISRDVAQRIVDRFPEIDLLWLLTGEGQMFADACLRGSQIPLYRADVEHDLLQREGSEPDEELVVPSLADCDLAMIYSGEAMAARIPAGTVVFLKKADVDEIIPGGEYVIVYGKIVTLRFVRAADDPEHWRLVACDRALFDDILVRKDAVEAVYKVRGKLILTN